MDRLPARVSALALVAALMATSCADRGATDPRDSVALLSGPVCGRTMVGSAVVVGDGRVLTNAHNVAGSAGGLEITFADGGVVPASVVAIDIHRDLALLTADTADRPVMPSGRLETGASGSVLRLDLQAAPTSIPFHDGEHITLVGHDIYDNESDVRRAGLRLAANVEPGYSGAPVLDGDGLMLGVVYAESRASDTVYAVAMDEVTRFIEDAAVVSGIDTGDCAP